MRFYRRLAPFKAISFDLDDTLYSNFPVMLAVDAKMNAYFKQVLAPLWSQTMAVLINGQSFDYQFWLPFRRRALIVNPSLIHDVAELRRMTYLLGFQSLGLPNAQAELHAQKALAYFTVHRSDFTVPMAVHDLLVALQNRWPLVAISNGNVDTHAIGIAKYFTAIFHAGKLYRQKPHADMFLAACNTLAIKPAQLLHVGDCGQSDIRGGLGSGCQTAWVSCYDVGKPLTVLPHIELSDVVDLHRLL